MHKSDSAIIGHVKQNTGRYSKLMLHATASKLRALCNIKRTYIWNALALVAYVIHRQVNDIKNNCYGGYNKNIYLNV